MHSAGYINIILWFLVIVVIGSESITSDSYAKNSLDSLLQQYAFRELRWPRARNGVPYDANVPCNLTGIRLSALMLRRHNLKRKIYGYYREFFIPSGIIEEPYARKLVLVYQNLATWSSFYYPLPGYTYLTPLLGILAYDAYDLYAKNVPELDILALKDPITIRFPYVQPAPEGSLPKCVYFYSNNWVEFRDVIDGNICLTRIQGHFAIVAPSPPPTAPSPSPTAYNIAPSPSPTADNIAPSPSPTAGGIAPSPSPTAGGITPSPAPTAGGIAPSPSPTAAGIAPSPAPTAGGIAPSPSPTAGGIALSPSPTAAGIAPSPAPTAGVISPSPSPTAGGIAPSPSPTAAGIAPSPAPTAGGISPSPAPTAAGIAPSPAPTAGGISPSPSPTAGGIAPSPAPTAGGISPSPSRTAGGIAPSPAPTAAGIAPSPSPTAGGITPSPSPTADGIAPSPSPTADEISPSPSPTADDHNHKKFNSKVWTISSAFLIFALSGILVVIVKRFRLLEIRQRLAGIVEPLLENTEAPLPLEAQTRPLS